MSFYVFEKEEKRTWKWSYFRGWWAIAVPGDIWYTLTHSTVVIILFLMLWKELFLKEIQGLKDLEGPKGLIWINTYVLDLVTFQRLLHDTFKKQTSKTQGLLVQIILWSPQWSFVSWISLSWVILLYPCGPGWKQESHGLSTHINHSEVKIWAITTEKLFLKLNYFLKNCFHLFVNFLTGRFLSRMPKNTQNL